MATGSASGFELAVREALRVLGTDVLGKPMWFVGAVADLYDPDSPEVTVLYAHCSDELLRPFAEAAEAGTTDALGQAARRAELWLHDVRRVDADDAHVVACAIAEALGEAGRARRGDQQPPKTAGHPRPRKDRATPDESPEQLVVFVLDTSESMRRIPVSELDIEMDARVDVLKQVAMYHRLTSVRIAVLEFNSSCRWLSPSGPELLEDFFFSWHDLSAGGEACLSAALEELDKKLRPGAYLGHRACLPIVIFMTDGRASDSWESVLQRVLASNPCFRRATRLGIAVGKDPDVGALSKLTGDAEAVFRDQALGQFANSLYRAMNPAMMGLGDQRAYENLENSSWQRPEDSPQGSGGATSASDPFRVVGVNPQSGIADYSWAQLKAIARAIAAAGGDAEGLLIAKKYNLVDAVDRLRGDTKPVTLKNGTQARVRILGFRHDELAGGGRAGITFEFADVPATHRMNAGRTNFGGWKRSEMRAWLNSGFLALLPGDLRDCVEETTKHANNAGIVSNKGNTSVVTGTSDKLWLLSMDEVYGSLSSQARNFLWYPAIYDAEGTQYQLYADQGVTTYDCKFCKKDAVSS